MRAPLSCKIVIAICTAQRPAMLRKCLESLAALEVPGGCTVEAAVVENDTEPRSREAVEAVASATGMTIGYAQETRRGIPFARNAALEAALAQGADWIALIDDDETARPDWLRLLYEACMAFDAEVANGPVHRIYEKDVPYWWKRQQLENRATGAEITEAPTNNILMSARIADPQGLGIRFEEMFVNGAEDIDFFRRVKAAGAKMIWVDEAYVDEFIPASRAAPGRLMNRLVMAACAGTQMKALREGRSVAWRDHGPKVVRRIFLGSLAVIVGAPLRLVAGQRGGKLLWYGITRICKGYGNAKGLWGAQHAYYTSIDGH